MLFWGSSGVFCKTAVNSRWVRSDSGGAGSPPGHHPAENILAGYLLDLHRPFLGGRNVSGDGPCFHPTPSVAKIGSRLRSKPSPGGCCSRGPPPHASPSLQGGCIISWKCRAEPFSSKKKKPNPPKNPKNLLYVYGG